MYAIYERHATMYELKWTGIKYEDAEKAFYNLYEKTHCYIKLMYKHDLVVDSKTVKLTDRLKYKISSYLNLN